MSRNQHKDPPACTLFITALVVLNAIVLKDGYTSGSMQYQWLYLTVPLLVIALIYQKGGGDFLLPDNSQNHSLPNGHLSVKTNDKKTPQNKVLILNDDYALLNACVKNTKLVNLKEPQHTRSLSEELQRAEVVDADKFPEDVVRLNAMVNIKDLCSGTETQLRIVLPEFADMKQKKVSVLAPMGTALIGLQKGQRFTWQMQGGIKCFLILDVTT
jgi:regulator of nucleoside diphosphate kinase